MQYDIAAIPTRYNGVQFRSRLEARWAAFFDLCGWRWEYEPFDLEGWAPDFLLRTPASNVFAEIKPTDIDQDKRLRALESDFKKAFGHWTRVQVLLLGMAPLRTRQGIGVLLDPPLNSSHDWADVYNYLTALDPVGFWREAGNIVQWHRS